MLNELLYLQCDAHATQEKHLPSNLPSGQVTDPATYNMRFGPYQAGIFQHINCKKNMYLPMT